LDSQGRLVLKGLGHAGLGRMSSPKNGQAEPLPGPSSQGTGAPSSNGREPGLLESIRLRSAEGVLLAEEKPGGVLEGGNLSDIGQAQATTSGGPAAATAGQSWGVAGAGKPLRMKWVKDEVEDTLSQLRALQKAGEALQRGDGPPSTPPAAPATLKAMNATPSSSRGALSPFQQQQCHAQTRVRAVQVGHGSTDYGELEDEEVRGRRASLLDQMRALQMEAHQLL